MKHYFKIFACALMCMFMCVLTSCENDVNEKNDDSLQFGEWTYLTQDGSFISGITLKDPKAPILTTNTEKKEPYVLDGYTDLKFRLRFTQENVIPYLNEVVPVESFAEAVKQIVKYESGKKSFIYNDYKQFKAKHPEIQEAETILIYYFAYIDGEPTITCDKVLFGLEPGTNLSKHFQVCDVRCISCIPSGIENPGLLYKYGDELPETMDKFFSDKSWVQEVYTLRLIDIPAEEYDDLTFHVSFPMILEHTIDYVIDQFNGLRPERKFTKQIFETDCKTVFKRD